MERPPSRKEISRIFSYDSMTTKEWEGGKNGLLTLGTSKLLSRRRKKKKKARKVDLVEGNSQITQTISFKSTMGPFISTILC